MSEQKFLKCKHCGNFISFIKNSGVKVVCCGEEMEELIPNHTDGATEKHVPDITISGNTVTVKVGSVPHPMADAHYIEFIYIRTAKGGQRKSLNPGDEPIAVFDLVDDTFMEAYEYCNLHGLWAAKAPGVTE